MPPIVCWDFDETLGYFRPLEFRFLGIQAPPGMPLPRLKPGIRDLLGSLKEFRHVVTTAAIREYAQEVLREQGLLEAFEGVIGREDGLFPKEGKDYKVVGDRFGIGESDLSRRLVIVGNDSKADPDYRYRQIVMVFDDRILDQPSEPIGVVLRNLAMEGSNDMKKGFDRLFDRAKQESRSEPALVLEQRVRAGIDYWGSFAEGKLHPMVIRPRLH